MVSADPRAIDRRDLAWYVDRAVQALVFIGGISGIVFIIGIFVFITKEGLGFITATFDFREFFFSPRWRPTSEANPTYGAMALIVVGLTTIAGRFGLEPAALAQAVEASHSVGDAAPDPTELPPCCREAAEQQDLP